MQTHGPSIWWVERVAIHSNAFHKEWTSLVAAALLIQQWCEDMKDGCEMNCAQFIEISSTKRPPYIGSQFWGDSMLNSAHTKLGQLNNLTSKDVVSLQSSLVPLNSGPNTGPGAFPARISASTYLPQNHVKNDEEWILPRSFSFFKHVLCLVNLPISEKNDTNWAGTLALHVCACASQSSDYSVICPWIEQCSKNSCRPTVLLGF